jgi:hypothetical protein
MEHINFQRWLYSRSTLVWLNKIQVERLQKNIMVGVDNVFKGNCVSLLTVYLIYAAIWDV